MPYRVLISDGIEACRKFRTERKAGEPKAEVGEDDVDDYDSRQTAAGTAALRSRSGRNNRVTLLVESRPQDRPGLPGYRELSFTMLA
jgi:hypothetical protein